MNKYDTVRRVMGRPGLMQRLMSADEAAVITAVSASRLRELAEAGLAPCVRVDGAEPRFYRADILAWVEDHLTEIQAGETLKTVVLHCPDPTAQWDELPVGIQDLHARLRRYAGHETACVYFLVKDRETIYVGKTRSLGHRVVVHRLDKDFDRVFYLPVPDSELSATEWKFIRALQPRLNIQGADPRGRDGATRHDAMQRPLYNWDKSSV